MDASLWTLFVSAFIASTLFPGGSEVVLGYLSLQTGYSLWLLLIIATLGNTLGGMTSWGLGRLITMKYSTATVLKPQHQKAVARLQVYGSPLLLLSWLPVIGDPLCVAAGWLRVHWLWSLLFIAIGKAGRYAAIIWLIN